MNDQKSLESSKDLHPERYDESLFRRAYKAGLELRKLNERDRKKKLIFQIAGGIVGLILVVGSIIYISNNRSPKYTKPEVFVTEQDIYVNSPARIYSFENLNPEISAQSILSFNPDSGQIYFFKDVDTRRQIASLTKLMTAIVAMDNMDLDEVITVNEIPLYGEDEIWSMELQKGDKVRVEDLLKMMLISSYNDAAIVLAESLGSEEFISLMNEKALLLDLKDTHFSNPCGFDSAENYSSANDLRKIVTTFLKYPTLADMAGNSSSEVEYIREGEGVKKVVYTTNSLLENEFVKGIKTGYTEDAGRCLITLFEYENNERLVNILLNSDDRYEDTEVIEGDIRDQLYW